MTETNYPTNWRKGFGPDSEWSIACGGDEIPMKIEGKWYLYVWSKKLKMHKYYCYEDDVFWNEDWVNYSMHVN